MKNYNSDFSYILIIIINCISKLAWVEILKDKSASSVANGFEKILKKAEGLKCLYPRNDKGGEYTSKHFQKVLKKHNIKHCGALNPVTKCSIAERFIRSIRMRIYRYFTHTITRRYIDVLDKIVYAYNRSRHCGTIFRPIDVTLKNAQQERKNFAKRYELVLWSESVVSQSFSENHTRVNFLWSCFRFRAFWGSAFPTLYILEDLEGEKIEGDFYEEELTQVDKNQTQISSFQKILRST